MWGTELQGIVDMTGFQGIADTKGLHSIADMDCTVTKDLGNNQKWSHLLLYHLPLPF